MKIAVSGANGFLGSKFTESLPKYGFQTLALVRPNADLSLLPEHQDVREVDYQDTASIQAAISSCDVLIHNAGKTRTLSFEEMLRANLGMTAKILEAANQSDLKQFIYISSQAASRPSPDGSPIDEEAESKPVNWYGKSKLWAERLIAKSCKIPWTILRPVPVYGPGDSDFLELFSLASKGLALSMGNAAQILNMISVDQLCDFTSRCVMNPEAFGQIFFASDGQAYRQSQITDAIANAVGKRMVKIRIPKPLAALVFSAGDMVSKISKKPGIINRQKYLELGARHWNCDISKAQRLLDWNPEPRLSENVKETYLWYRAHGWL